MPLLNIVLILIVIGVALWFVNAYIPMAAPIKTLINVVIVVVLCVWLLSFFGVGDVFVGHRVR